MTTNGYRLRPDDIVGYSFRADTFCPGCIIRQLPTGDGEAFDGWALAEGVDLSVEENLTELAAAFGIDRQDEASFDSGDFPKVVFRDSVNDERCEHCGDCGEHLVETECFDISDEDDHGIPADHPVQPCAPEDAAEPATCGTCGLTWDDGISTSLTPAPAGRCPFEYFHEEDDNTTYEIVGLLQAPGMFDTIVQLVGKQDDKLYRIAADHRMAQPIIEELYDGNQPMAYAEDWAVSRLPEDTPILVPSTEETA